MKAKKNNNHNRKLNWQFRKKTGLFRKQAKKVHDTTK